MPKASALLPPKRRVPAYQHIKQAILTHIHSGKWQTGDAIPSEHRLAELFGVSRMTVNRALKELSEERVLLRRQGAGTFVAQQQFNHTFVEVRNIAADIKAEHRKYEAKVLSQQRLHASDVSAGILDKLSSPMLNDAKFAAISALEVDEAFVDEVKILHIADGQPIQYEERWVNTNLVPNFIVQDFTVVNTSDYLIAQAPLEGGGYTIRAVTAPQAVTEALNMQAGEPALLLSRQTYSAGQVVTFVNMWHASHHYQISGTL